MSLKCVSIACSRRLTSLPAFKWVERAFLFVAFGTFYWLTRIRQHTYDGWTYVMSAQIGSDSLFHLLFPHHLMYHPLMFAIAELAKWTGLSGGSLGPLEVANVLIATSCSVLFYATCRRSFDRAAALGLVGLLSVSNAYWRYASEVEVYHFSLIFQLVLVNLLLDLRRGQFLNHRKMVTVGVVFACAVLAHQTNFLLAILISFIVLSDPSPLRKRAQSLFTFSVVSAAILLMSYGLAVVALGYRSLRDIAFWLTAYAHLGTWGKLVRNSASDSLTTQVNSFVQLRDVSAFVLVLSVLGFILIAILAVRRDLGLAQICLGWYLPNLLFFSWWEPGNKEFWISSLPAMLILLGLATSGRTLRVQRALRVLVVALVPLVVWNNWSQSISQLQDPEADIRESASLALADCLPEGLLIVANNFAFPWQAYYYHPGQARMLDFYFFLPDKRLRGRAQLDADIRRVWDDGKPVYVTEEAVDLTNHTPVFYGRELEVMEDYFEKFSLEKTGCTYPYGGEVPLGVFEIKPVQSSASGVGQGADRDSAF